MKMMVRNSVVSPALASEPFLGQIILFLIQLLRLFFGGRGGVGILLP